VILDNERGISILVDHLVEHGHRRIGLLSGSLSETSGHERRDAFRKAMKRHAPRVTVAGIAGSRWAQEDGRESTLKLLARKTPPTAIVTASVELALGALLACRERGLRVPEDLAIATFDDAYFAELLDPPLTAVAYDPADVGQAAAAMLVEAMGEDEPKRRDLSIPVRLITRRSCGCNP
jgi:DNA-binding LacI/PurR family transcriptional regulator